MNKLCCVSGYWNVTNKHGNKFNNWFNNTLKVNCTYIFFCDPKDKNYIDHFRKDLPTYYYDFYLDDFYTNKYNFDISQTHPIHCPSIELGKIWLEKINLMYLASKQNVYNSEWYLWIDAGICTLRNKEFKLNEFFEFSSLDKLDGLDKNKLYYTSTKYPNFNVYTINLLIYTHEVAGTAFLIHKDKIEFFKNLFYKYLDQLFEHKDLMKHNPFFIFSDQCVWSLILSKHPDLFCKVGNGYGEIINYLK
jgi:hypothetical protein